MRSLLFVASILLALPVQAQELVISANDTVQTVIGARKGKPVTLRLTGGQEITGTVRDVSTRLVVLGALAGREFFDAAVPLEKIEAVVVRTK